MEVFRRAAASAKVFASGGGHGDLSHAISQQKAIVETGIKLITAVTDASLYTYKWARSEENKAIEEVFHKMCGLTTLWSESQRELFGEYKRLRDAFKEIRHEEKNLDDARKVEGSCSTKLAKLKKQMEATKKKNDVAKIDLLMPELKQAVIANDKANEELTRRLDTNEALKAIKLKDGLISLSNTGIEMAEKMQEIFAAQRKLAELITSETVPNSNTASNDQFYAGVTRKSNETFDALCRQLGVSAPPLPGDGQPTLKTYVRASRSQTTRAPLPLPPPLPQSPPPTSFIPPQKLAKHQYAEPDAAGPPGIPPRRSFTFQEPLGASGVGEYVEPDNDGKEDDDDDDYTKPRDMYTWIWQRQSTILGGGGGGGASAGGYTQVYDEKGPSPKGGSSREASPNQSPHQSPRAGRAEASRRKGARVANADMLREDSVGYLLPKDVIDGGDGSAKVRFEISDDNKGDYAYARVVTTSAIPPKVPIRRSRSENEGGSISAAAAAIAKLPVKERKRPPVPPAPFQPKPTGDASTTEKNESK